MITLLNKTWRDLNKKKARTIFTVLTIMFGVAALGMFAVMPLVDDSMREEMDRSNMHDVLLRFDDTDMDKEMFESINGLDNVRGSEAMSIMYTKIKIGERRNVAWIVGVADLGEMSVDRISLEKGNLPNREEGELLTERANIDVDLIPKGIGSRVGIYDTSGNLTEMMITGIAHNPHFSGMPFGGVAVFYTTLETARDLANSSGYNLLALDLGETDRTIALTTMEEVRTVLSINGTFEGFSQMPQIRQNGDWPLKELFESVGQLFNVIAYIVLFCGVFLISNTMHTIITEQRREIARMKALGATRSQVLLSYLTTSMTMGIVGSTLGALVGILIAVGMANMFGSMIGIRVGLDIHWATVIVSFTVGSAITVLASVPALVIALRVPVREGMEGCGISSSYGSSFIDRLLMNGGSARLPAAARMGLRNATRSKGRSLSTMLQVSLAVGMLLGVITCCIAMTDEIDREFSCVTYDIQTTGQEDGARPLTRDAGYVIEEVTGVVSAEPFISTMVGIDDYNTVALAYSYDTRAIDIGRTVSSGRWFTSTDEEQDALVAILNNRVAAATDTGIGDSIELMTRDGLMSFQVVGITIQVYAEIYLPLSTVSELLGYGSTVSGFNIITESKDHSEIDRVATEVEDSLMENGYMVNNQVWYVSSKQATRGAESTVSMMVASGGLIVLVTMIGLMSMLTMNVVERTKEVGILRCVGSSSFGVASVFGLEGLFVAIGGWIVGLPVGYGVQMILTGSIRSSSGMQVPYIFPASFVLISFFITVVIATLIIQPPLWKAGKLRPGEALRYQ